MCLHFAGGSAGYVGAETEVSKWGNISRFFALPKIRFGRTKQQTSNNGLRSGNCTVWILVE